MAQHVPGPIPENERLAAVSGIITASRVPAGQQPKIPTGIFGGYALHGTKVCIVCGSTTAAEGIKEHFIACMLENGNPMGLHWFHNFIDVPRQDFDESSYHSDELSTASPTPQDLVPMPQSYIEQYHKYGFVKAPHQSAHIPTRQSLNTTVAVTPVPLAQAFIPPTGRPETPNLENLTDKEARLARVNGVLIPSKLGPGQRPNQGKRTGYVAKDRDTKCNMCGRAFASPQRARLHFAPCVETNGNPYGVRWDDAYSSDVLGNVPDGGSRVSNRIIPQPTRRRLIRMKPSEPISTPYDTFPQAPLTMTDRKSAMGVLSNGELLDMLQAWQGVISSGQEAHASMDVGFQEVMTELQERQLIDRCWLWSVDDWQIDKTSVRIAARARGSEHQG